MIRTLLVTTCLLLPLSGCKKAEWKQRKIDELGISLRLPEPPKRETESVKTPIGKNLETVLFKTRAGQAEYWVFNLDYSAIGVAIDSDAMLRGSVKGFLGSADTAQMTMSPSALGDYLGAELAGPVPKGGKVPYDAWIGARLFVMKDKKWLLGVLGVAPAKDKETVVAFLESLALTP